MWCDRYTGSTHAAKQRSGEGREAGEAVRSFHREYARREAAERRRPRGLMPRKIETPGYIFVLRTWKCFRTFWNCRQRRGLVLVLYVGWKKKCTK